MKQMFLTLFFLATLHLHGQTGSISGRVLLDGMPIKGAVVKAMLDEGKVADTITDSMGYYSLFPLPIGVYNLIFSLETRYIQLKGIVVRSGESTVAYPLDIPKIHERVVIRTICTHALPNLDNYQRTRYTNDELMRFP